MAECRQYYNSTCSLFVSFLLATFLRGCCLQAGSLAHPVNGNIATVDVQEDLITSVYVVHVRKPPRLLHAGPEELAAWHRSFLPSPAVDSGEPRLVFSYSKAMSGFAARLTPEEAADMADLEGFLYAAPDEKLDRQTTHTPDFLRLRPDVWRAANRGHDVIVGVVDSGINPEHVSFSGSGGVRERPPGKWRGYCEFRGSRTCGRKLLGARNYDSNARGQQRLPYDVEGHGTHVASTVAGGEVPGAGLHGHANGTASGAAPDAFLSVYKAQTVAETLAAINQAIEDGVDVLCIAVAHREAHLPIFLDGVAIGALAAVREGILVVGAAGNYGPSHGTLRNDAPWFVTVGASSTDRALRASLRLGNGVDLAGESLYDFDGKLLEKMPLLYPTPKKGHPPSEPCADDLRRGKFQGKIVLCHAGSNTTTEMAKVVKDAGGLAAVVMNSPDNGTTIADVPDVDFPALSIDYNTSLKLIDYVTNTRRPIAAFGPGKTTFGNHPAPAVASFSARGPSDVNGGILKPDVLGPGVNVLAASHAGKTGFLLASGTSVAAAHVAGVAAIVNKSNSGWTPAMMRSAIMTTGALEGVTGGGPITDETGSAASLFATGAGHVNPAKAVDPGLVYDVEFQDYVRFLCGLGYTDVQASVVAGYSVQCAKAGSVDAEQLNYPSISVKLGASTGARKTVARTLTSVHCAMGLYRARLQLPPGAGGSVSAKVSPRRLLFWGRGERRRFTVTFKVTNSTSVKAGQAIGGRLRWSSDMHAVSSALQITLV